MDRTIVTRLAEELADVTRAILEVTRSVVLAEESSDGVYSDQTVVLPPPPAGSRLTIVADRAGLAPVERTLLRLLVAAELDRHAYRALQRLSSDPTRPGVPADGLITAVEGMGGGALEALLALRPDATLLARGLITWHEPSGPVIARRAVVPPRLLQFLAVGADGADGVVGADGAPAAAGVADAAGRAGVRSPLPPLEAPPLLVADPPPLEKLCPLPLRDEAGGAPAGARLRGLLPSILAGLAGEPVWLTGAAGAGKRTLIASVAREAGHAALCLDYREAQRYPVAELVPSLWRELILHDALLVVHEADSRGDGVDSPDGAPPARADRLLPAFYDALRRAGLPMVFVSTQPPQLTLFERPPSVLRLGAASPVDAFALWRAELPGCDALPEVASKFRLPPGRIARAARAAVRLAAAAERPVQARDVGLAVSIQVAQQVSTLGLLVEDTQTWDDVVLPAETLDAVKEMVARVRFRHRVLEDWGFRRKLSKGLGVAALFSGPPGTGKTMVASLIARELAQELYLIDLSRIVSKWVGETEKNLARVFDAAEGANVMLLFDEADALFSKRTEVRSANDRHANAEINYLLQRVERFEGISVLTTNLEGAIDTAFKRRLTFRIAFPMPDVEERAELWRRMLPRQAEVAPGIDFARLARAYELTGGNIKNAVLRAAFLAAAEASAIRMEHLERAVKLEYRDAGKLAAVGRMHPI